MAEEPSAKHHHGEMSDKSSNLDDVHVADEKRAYTRTLKGVELHGKEMLEIDWTSESDKADEMMTRLGMKASVIHPFYKGMKENINKEEDYKLWGISPLPDKLIEYAGKDAYATYKSWKIIAKIVTGWDISKEQEADPYYHYNFAG
ncbi:hypothetical protein VPH35_009509 [Triticum aestivum]